MKSSSPQIEHLKRMLSLEEKRSAVQAELDSIDAQLNELKQRLVSGSPVVSAPKATASKPQPAAAQLKAPKAPKARAGRSGRGELKGQIFAALDKAGATGVKVLDIARDLGTKPANIYAWFHAALKRYPNIKKTDGGTYRLAGKAPAAETSPAKAPAKAPAKISKAPKAAVKATAPAAKPAKAPNGAKSAGRGARGEVSGRIVEQLKAAGASGVTIKDLSAKLGMPYRNLQVWFATTGKKQKGIKKIAPATYQLK